MTFLSAIGSDGKVRGGLFVAALAEGMRTRFPERDFEVSEDGLEMIVLNENDELDGLYISEETSGGLMVATDWFIHWHFYCNSSDRSSEIGIEKRVTEVVAEVLDHLGAIFDDSTIMYSGEAFWGFLTSSGSYKRGERPRMRFWFGKLVHEWCWSRSLLP